MYKMLYLDGNSKKICSNKWQIRDIFIENKNKTKIVWRKLYENTFDAEKKYASIHLKEGDLSRLDFE